MEIIELPITKIRPDPTQPRKSFDEEELEGMAQSIKTEGVINAIEVDPNYIIITGERRWRAAKIAGHTTIPVKIMKIGKEDRFMRQVIENIHHNTMNDWDTANALKKMLSWPRISQHKTPHTGNVDKGIRWLSTKTGKSRWYISEKLEILKASPRFQKAIQKNDLTSNHLRILSRTPKEHKVAIEKKIFAGEFKTSEVGIEVAAALRRDPTKAKEILAKDYSKYPTKVEAGGALSKIAPRATDHIIAAIKPTEQLGKLTTDLLHWLDTNTPESVGKHNLHRCVVNLQTAEKEIAKWLKVK